MLSWAGTSIPGIPGRINLLSSVLSGRSGITLSLRSDDLPIRRLTGLVTDALSLPWNHSLMVGQGGSSIPMRE